MKVTITGAAGFLGQKLARALLAGRQLIDGQGVAHTVEHLLLADVVAPAADIAADPRVTVLIGDIGEAGFLADCLPHDLSSVFHLAAVVSAGAEADFDLGMRINLTATQQMLEILRHQPGCPKLVFASSCAAYGGDMADIIDDRQQVTPQTSYGTQKAIGELLVNDYSRKGFLDGRALRFPTVVVRPGKPNKAASTFASSIIREPLQGQRAVCPVAADTPMWLASPRSVVENIIRGHDRPGADFQSWRALAIPGFSVPVGEMVEALKRVAGNNVAALIDWQPDPAIEKIVYGWPAELDTARAYALDMVADASMDAVVQAFIDDDLDPAVS